MVGIEVLQYESFVNDFETLEIYETLLCLVHKRVCTWANDLMQ
jgi:hypothetical protein